VILESRKKALSFLCVFLFLGSEALARDAKPAPPRPKVFVVGWDGGDWNLLDALLKEGRLPNLAHLVGKGRTWDLETYQPMASPLIWTTIATGRSPVDHGVTDFQELDPKSRARLPISGRSRKVPAIWNLATAKGLSVGVVGWWASWPAERVKGFLVSDRSSPVLFDPEMLSKSAGLTWPEGLADGVRIVIKREGTPGFDEIGRSLKVSRAEFDDAVSRKLDLSHPITAFQKVLGSTRVHAKIGLDLYEREKPDLLMVYFQGTDEIGHVMARFHPPRLKTTSEEDFRKFSAGVVSFYVEADRILGDFIRKAERDNATVILLSDHGFRWGESRPAFYSGTRFDTAFLWHENPGMMAAMGPGVTPTRERGKASVFDVAPTLCRLLGLPADPAFEGKVITGFSPKAMPPAVAAVSWEKTAKVERLAVSTNSPEERQAAEEFTKKLIALGYLTGSEASAIDARPPDRAGTETAGSFANVGTYLRVKGQPEKAIEWYRKALEVNPKAGTVWYNLSVTLHTQDRWNESDDALLEAAKNGYQDPEATIFRRVATYIQRFEKRPEARAQLLSFLEKATAAFPQNDRYRSALGKQLFENRDCEGSEKIFRGLAVKQPNDVEVLNLLALTTWCQGRLQEAREFFQKSLKQNPDQPAVREGLTQLERGGKFAQ
jgi:tetratricopeptide (TPR) repeat protein